MKKQIDKKIKSFVPVSDDKLFSDICSLIEKAKQRISYYVNAGLTLLYWNVGDQLAKSAGE
ncbi:MAG: hypothetical protein ACD_79C00188G0002 [uncultured bacterium]|nr:MAG: hypothetical protein ACD_79C00188G0002 [uncultured bacterium]